MTRRKKRQLDTSVPSPCLAICQIEEGQDICSGCLRSSDEIRSWMIMTREEKLDTLQRVAERRAELDSKPTEGDAGNSAAP